MKIIHTGDWHLGSTIYDYDRANEHKAFLAQILAMLAEDSEISAVFITGDIFHVGNPSNEAERMFCDFLVSAKKIRPNVQIFAIAGNHDGGFKLDTAGGYCSLTTDIHLIGSIPYAEEAKKGKNNVDKIDYAKLVFPLYDKAHNEQAYAVVIPFIRTSLLRSGGLFEDSIGNHTLAECLEKIYKEALLYAKSKNGRNLPILALGHLTVHGSKAHDTTDIGISAISIGGEESVNVNIFKGYDYVALGHIHLAQSIDNVHYAGSPMPINAGEADYQNGLITISINENGEITKEFQKLQREVDLIRIPKSKGAVSYGELASCIKALGVSKEPLNKRPFLTIHIAIDEENSDTKSRFAMLDEVRSKISNSECFRLGPIVLEAIKATTNQDPFDDAPLETLSVYDVFEKLYQTTYPDAQGEVPSYLKDAFTQLVELYQKEQDGDAKLANEETALVNKNE